MYNLDIISKTKTWYTVSGALIILSIVSLLIFGLNLGIDFTGGSMLDIEFNEIARPSISEIEDSLASFELSNLKIQPTGEDGYIIRMQNIDEETHQAILKNLNEKFVVKNEEGNESSNPETIQVEADGPLEIKATTTNGLDTIIEKRFDSIGPVIGEELKNKSLWAMLIVLIAIVLYIAYVFRKVSKPVESWK